MYLFSFNDLCKKEDTNNDKGAIIWASETTDDYVGTANSQLLNGKAVQASCSIKVNRAFLAFKSGAQVPVGNKARYDKKVKLNINFDCWAAQDIRVSLGASEKVITAGSDILLDEADTFGSFANGLDE